MAERIYKEHLIRDFGINRGILDYLDRMEEKLGDSGRILVRPSGTEPKIKVYILGVGASRPECDERVQRYAKFAETLRG